MFTYGGADKVASQQLSPKTQAVCCDFSLKNGTLVDKHVRPALAFAHVKAQAVEGRGFRSSARVGKGEQQQGRACSRIKNKQTSARTLEEHNRRHSLPTFYLWFFCCVFKCMCADFVSSSRKWKPSTPCEGRGNLITAKTDTEKCGRSRFHTPFCSSRVSNPPLLPVSVYAINNSDLINKLLVQAERRPGNFPGSSWFMNATQSNAACKSDQITPEPVSKGLNGWSKYMEVPTFYYFKSF